MTEAVRRFEAELSQLAAGRDPGLLSAVLDRARPLLTVADPRPLGLAPAAGFSFKSVNGVLRSCLARPIRCVRFVSADAARRGLEGLTDDRFEARAAAALHQRLQGRIWHTLGNHLGRRYSDRLWDSFRCPAEGRLLAKLVRDRPGNDLVDSLLFRMQDVVGNGREEALFFFYGAGVIGDRDMAGRLRRLIDLMRAGALPLGEKAGEDGVWYVLTA